MTSQPILIDASSVPEQIQPPPGYLFWLGLGALLVAPFFTLVNTVVVMLTISRWSGYGVGSGGLSLLWINIALVAALGGLLFLAGVGLMLRQRWGRTLAILYFVSTFMCSAYGVCNATMSGVVGTVEIAEAGGGSYMGPQEFEGIGLLAPLATPYALALIIFMILPKSRAWAHATPLPARYTGPSKISFQSIASMVLAIISGIAGLPLMIGAALLAILPTALEAESSSVVAMLLIAAVLLVIYFIVLLASLMMGLSAVKKTSSSAGRVKGQAMAWVGVIGSTLLLTTLLGMTLSGVTTAAIASPSRIFEGFKQRIDLMEDGGDYGPAYNEPTWEY